MKSLEQEHTPGDKPKVNAMDTTCLWKFLGNKVGSDGGEFGKRENMWGDVSRDAVFFPTLRLTIAEELTSLIAPEF